MVTHVRTSVGSAAKHGQWSERGPSGPARQRQERGTMSEPGYVQPDYSLLGEEHVRRYQETDGEVGHLWNGAPILLLTTTGRRSGRLRTTPLIFGRDGDDHLVVASMGGAPAH